MKGLKEMKKERIESIVFVLFWVGIGMLIQRYLVPMIPLSKPIDVRFFLPFIPLAAAGLIKLGLSTK